MRYGIPPMRKLSLQTLLRLEREFREMGSEIFRNAMEQIDQDLFDSAQLAFSMSYLYGWISEAHRNVSLRNFKASLGL